MNEDDSTAPHLYQKLPKCITPVHYELFLKPDLKKCTFEGTVNVTLLVNTATNQVRFHSVDLQLINVRLHDGSADLPIRVSICNQSESVRLDVEGQALASGRKYVLSVEFNGALDENMRGFYKAQYISPSGEQRFCAVTQFEASKAHRCFPCWDEPAFKATFDITVSCARDRVALSNMPVMNEKFDDNGNKTVQFSTSPLMSTYLVAVVVGEFDFIEGLTPKGVKVRVYTPLGKTEPGQFALDAAVKILPYFEDFFKVLYPLPKLDLVAVPSLSFGAMENWGLITYRETCLLVDPKVSSIKQIQYVALVVAHEIAHQWFGNLVTMEWWDHLWLNEGYATFMEFLSVGKLYPDLNIWNHFIDLVYSPAMKMDALATSHPVEVPVNHPLHVDEIFDDISYNKGASLIRMLYGYIGEADFEKGMNMYLKKFQYQNASTDDLWDVLEQASQKPISSMMPSWTRRLGYPVISVEREQQGSECKLKMRQFKFCASGNKEDESIEDWVVPIEYATMKSQGKAVSRFEFKGKEWNLTIDDLDQNNWIKLNPGSFGFYRVQYSSKMLEDLMPAISTLSLPPLDRSGVLDDLFALVQAGYSRSDKICELLLAMCNEDTCLVWVSMSRVALRLKKLVEYADESTQANFMAFGKKLLENIKKCITWDPQPDEGHDDKLRRSVVLELLGVFDDGQIIAEAEKRLRAHLDGSSSILPDLRSVVYSIGVKNAGFDLYESVLNMYHSATLQEEKERILFSLAAMKDEALIGHLLKFAVSDDVRKETSLSILSAISQTLAGRQQVWAYALLNWDQLTKRYAGTFALPRFISGVFSCAASNKMASELEEIARSPSRVLGIERSIDQAIEKIRVNVAWLERDLSVITSFLNRLK